MTTDDRMLNARILALKKAKAALEWEGRISSAEIRTRLDNSEEGQKLSPSQKCAIEHILDALEAVLQGNEVIAPHPNYQDCRDMHEGRP